MKIKMYTFVHSYFQKFVHFYIDINTKKVYNILGDYPDVIAKFLVERMITNKKNDVKINWLTNAKASFRFMTSAFIKE